MNMITTIEAAGDDTLRARVQASTADLAAASARIAGAQVDLFRSLRSGWS